MRKTLQLFAVLLIIASVSTGCQGGSSNRENDNLIRGDYELESTQSAGEVQYLSGETLYVPIYSSIFSLSKDTTYELTATLSIHNVDLDHSIKVTKADYYNTNGHLMKSYLEKGLILKPLQTVQIVIPENDKSGGTGANFIVEWVSECDVTSPIVEAIMISTKNQQGIAFTSVGKVIKATPK